MAEDVGPTVSRRSGLSAEVPCVDKSAPGSDCPYEYHRYSGPDVACGGLDGETVLSRGRRPPYLLSRLQAQELRVLAALSQDPTMIEAFKNNADLHQMTADAARVERSVGKMANFLNVYGGGPGKLAESADISFRWLSAS